MFLAPWLVCALLAWLMWWYWQRQKRSWSCPVSVDTFALDGDRRPWVLFGHHLFVSLRASLSEC